MRLIKQSLAIAAAIICTTSQLFCASAGAEPSPREEASGYKPVTATRYKDQTVPVFDGSAVKVDRTVSPWFPFQQRRDHVEGACVILVFVSETGKAIEFGIVSSTPEPEFGAAAVAAAKKWRYYPLVDNSGHGILHALRFEFEFTLPKDSK